jgi:hypothetical protein
MARTIDMPSRAETEVVHVSSAPTRSGISVGIRVTSMTLNHARWWHQYVQPWIDRSVDARADRGWRWPRIFATTQMIGNMLGQRPVGLVAGVVQRDEFMPVAMAMLVEAYPHLPDPSKQSVFLWYATRCPDQVMQMGLKTTSDAVPKRLMEITVDMAITHSFNKRYAGRVGLHAAKEGGEELCSKYATLGMIRLPAKHSLPIGVRWRRSGNDGRYFYHSEETALRASQKLDQLR